MARSTRVGAVLLTALLASAVASSEALSLARPGTYAPLLGGGSASSAVQTLSGSDGLTCGDVVSVFSEARTDANGVLSFSLVADAAVSATRGAGFSDCLRSLLLDADGVLIVSGSLSGELFASGSSLTCAVTSSAPLAAKNTRFTVRTDLRVACEAGSSPAGALAIKLGDIVARITDVEKMNGAGSAYLTLDKTVTTGDGLCGVHDSVELTDSYTTGDSREVKFCYTLVNRGTQHACDVALEQATGLTEGGTLAVELSSLTDICTVGKFSSLPASTTAGASTVQWSTVLAEKVVRYPCGVTRVDPQATVKSNNAVSARATVRINTQDSCGVASARLAPVAFADDSVRQTISCTCMFFTNKFYVLEPIDETTPVGSIDGRLLYTCTLQSAVGGYACVNVDPLSLPSQGSYEICYVQTVIRYVPAGQRLWDGVSLGDTVGCEQRSVSRVYPAVLSRLI